MTAENDTMQQTPAPERCAARPAAEAALDLWLRQNLAGRYDATLKENLPADMVALLTSLH